MRCDATHTASSTSHHHRAADDDYVATIPGGHHRRLSSGRLSNVPSSGSLHSLLPPHRGRRRCRFLLLALATVLGLQLLAHALFPVASPLPAIAEGITSLSHSAALLAHSTHHFWADTPPPTPHDLPPTAIPRTLHLIGGTLRGGASSDPACALLGDGRWTVHHYTEAAAAAMVHRELPRTPIGPAQRLAVFRLLVLLQHGGVAMADHLDCHRDLETVLLNSSMAVGWDTDARTIGLQFIAAAPRHPVLLDVLQRMGDGLPLQEQWTAAVLRHAASNLTQQWGVRVLPASLLGPGPDSVLVATAGPSTTRGWCTWLPSAVQRIACRQPRYATTYMDCAFPSTRRAHRLDAAPGMHESTAALLRAVVLPWQPPFTLLLPPAGTGEDEVSRQLLRTGTWQPGRGGMRQQRPHPLSTLLDALDAAAAEPGESPLFLDLGAGHGVAAGAAAARGHAVVAVEPSEALRGALQATARQPQLRERLWVHGGECVGLGSEACLCSNGVVVQQVWGVDPCAATLPCTTSTQVCEPSIASILPPNTTLAAVRVRVPCYEAAVLRALVPLVAETAPRVVHVELACDQPATGNLTAALQVLRAVGYEGMAHAGRVCDARWDGLAASAGLGVGGTNTHRPTWCRLDEQHMGLIEGPLHDVETVVLER